MGRSKEEKEARLALRKERRKKIQEDRIVRISKKETIEEPIKEEKKVKEEVKHIKVKKKERTFSGMETFLMMLAMLSIGFVIGLKFTEMKMEKENPYRDSIALEIYKDIKKNFYGILTDKFEYTQISGMVLGLNDSHAKYLEGNYALEYKQQLNNEFVGIGTEVQMLETKEVVFMNVYKDSPAEKAGIVPGDILVKIDDKELTGLTLEEIVFRIKGKNTKKEVKVTINRSGEYIDLTITKENIVPKSVTVEYLHNDTIALVSISSFTTKTLNEVKTILDEVKEKGVKNLALDVRDNNLGYISVASDIASLFLDKGVIIYKEKYVDSDKVIKSENDKLYDFNLAIVQNRNSAKASEILSSALKNNAGANIIGTESKGDSTIQKMIELDNGDIVEYTVGRWYTSLDGNVAAKKISPNYIVSDDNYNDKIIESFNNML